jgi:hypothetical protein
VNDSIKCLRGKLLSTNRSWSGLWPESFVNDRCQSHSTNLAKAKLNWNDLVSFIHTLQWFAPNCSIGFPTYEKREHLIRTCENVFILTEESASESTKKLRAPINFSTSWINYLLILFKFSSPVLSGFLWEDTDVMRDIFRISGFLASFEFEVYSRWVGDKFSRFHWWTWQRGGNDLEGWTKCAATATLWECGVKTMTFDTYDLRYCRHCQRKWRF